MRYLNSLEKRFPWGIAGVFTGLLSFAAAVFIYYLSSQELKTNILFRVTDEFHLVELKDDFPKIRILYDNVDILASNKTIKIVTLRLENHGRSILHEYFDKKLQFGLKFDNSVIIDVSPIFPLESYLRDSLFKSRDSINMDEYHDGKVVFNKPMIEKGSQISFKVYLLQEQEIETTVVEAMGYILGSEKIDVIQFDPERKAKNNSGSKTFLETTIDVIKWVGVVFFVISIFAIISANIEFRKAKKKERLREESVAKFIKEQDDLPENLEKELLGYDTKWPSYYRQVLNALVKEGQPLVWNPAIFSINEGKIGFNQDNKDTVVEFLSIISGEKTKTDDSGTEDKGNSK